MRKILSIVSKKNKVAKTKKVRFSTELCKVHTYEPEKPDHGKQVAKERKEGNFNMKKSTTSDDLKSYDIVCIDKHF